MIESREQLRGGLHGVIAPNVDLSDVGGVLPPRHIGIWRRAMLDPETPGLVAGRRQQLRLVGVLSSDGQEISVRCVNPSNDSGSAIMTLRKTGGVKQDPSSPTRCESQCRTDPGNRRRNCNDCGRLDDGSAPARPELITVSPRRELRP
jgi:hypothetical protein